MIPHALLLAAALAGQVDDSPRQVTRIGSPEFRHREYAFMFGFSADGKRLYTGEDMWGWGRSKDGAIFVWEVDTGRLIARHVVGRPNHIYSQVGYGPDGVRILATVGDYGGEYQLRTVDPETGKTVKTGPTWKDPQPFPDGTSSSYFNSWSAVSPNADWMIRPGKGNTLRLLATSTGAETLIDIGYPPSVIGLEYGFSADGRYFHTVQKGIVHLYELPSGKRAVEMANPGDEQHAATFTPDGKQLLLWVRRDKVWSLDAWDIATKTRRTVLAGRPLPGRVTLSQDGKRFALVPGTIGSHHPVGDCEVRDFATGKEFGRLPTASYNRDVLFSPDGRTLFMRPGGGGVVVPWDVATGKPTAAAPSPLGSVHPFRFNAGGELVGYAGGYVYTWDPLTGKALARDRVPRTIDWYGAMAFNPNADRFQYVESGNRRVSWDFRTGAEGRFPLATPLDVNNSQYFTPDCSRYYEHLHNENAFAFFDPETGKRTARVAVPKAVQRSNGGSVTVRGVATSADGKRVALGSYAFEEHDSERTWKLSFIAVVNMDGSGKPLVITATADAHVMAFSPDGRFLVAPAQQRPTIELGIWDTVGGRRVATLDFGYDTEVCALEFSPCGRMLAVSLTGGGIRLIETATWRVRTRLFDTFSRSPVAWSPEGRLIATSALDGGALTWDVRQPNHAAQGVDAAAIDQAWAALGGDDAPAAYHAIHTLAANPDRVVPMLKAKLPPVALDAAKLKATIDALGSEDFEERERATEELARLGRLAEAGLRGAIGKADSAEVVRRATGLLDKLAAGRVSAEEVRVVRAVEAAEWAGTAEAVRLLEAWAGGAEGARLTTEAKAALTRMKK